MKYGAMKCARCGQDPEVLIGPGTEVGNIPENRAQVKCFFCGNAARPAWAWRGDEQSLINRAVGFWNEEQRHILKIKEG